MPTRTYKVGPRSVLGHEPGTTFSAELDPIQEARLVQGRALEILDGQEAEAPTAPESSTNLSPEQLEELQAMSPEDLKDLAKDIGVKGAEGLKSKQALIDAIAAHQGGSTEGDSQHG